MTSGEKKKNLKTIAVASGKGGVGKTNVAANLAIAIQKLGKQVLLMDADLGLANVEVLLNLAPDHSIHDLLSGSLSVREILVEGPHGIQILPAGTGMQDLTALNEFQRFKILAGFDAYESDTEVLLIDTAAGISENVAFFCSAVQEILIVTTQEPTSIRDASALISVLHEHYQEKKFLLLVNCVKSAEQALDVFSRLSQEAARSFDISLDYLGYLPYDDAVPAAVREQKAFLDLYPQRSVSLKITEMALKLLDRPDKVKGTLQFFIANLLSMPAPMETGGN